MIKDPQNKVAVITGGASGIGLAMARSFIDGGMQVVIADNRQDGLDEAVATLQAADRLLAVNCDVSDPDQNVMLAQSAKGRFGGVNVVCLNAGIGRVRHSITEVPIDEWRLQMSVNLDGPFYGVKAFLPLLEEQKEAQIVITASVMSLFGGMIIGPYFVTKAGLLSYAECLYLDLKAMDSHIGVTCLMPGNTATNQVANCTTDDSDPELIEMVAAELRTGTPPQVIGDAVFKAIQTDQFYLLPNVGDFWMQIDARHDRIKTGRNPSLDEV